MNALLFGFRFFRSFYFRDRFACFWTATAVCRQTHDGNLRKNRFTQKACHQTGQRLHRFLEKKSRPKHCSTAAYKPFCKHRQRHRSDSGFSLNERQWPFEATLTAEYGELLCFGNSGERRNRKPGFLSNPWVIIVLQQYSEIKMPTCNLDIPRPLRARVDAFSLEQQAWLVNEDDAVGQRRETMLALWGPSSDAGRRVHEFEEFLSQGVKHWKSISEYHDGLQSHRLSCKLNHSSQFQSFEDAVAKFLKAATIVVDILIPATEREFGTLRNGAALKQCRDEARSISSPVDFELLD